MSMSQAAHLRVVSSPSSHPYLYSVHRLPQAAPTSFRPSPEVILRKSLGSLLTVLKSTLAGTFVSVASKRLTSRPTSVLTPLDATLTKNRGEGGLHPSLLPTPSHLRGASAFAVSDGTTEIISTSSGLPNRADRI